MSSIRKYFMMNHKAEQDGIWVQVNDVRFKLARAGGSNKNFAKTLERLTRPHRRAIQLETLDPALGEEIMRRTYAETVVLDWDGPDESDVVSDPTAVREGTVYDSLPFSVENCVALLKAQPDLFNLIRELADNSTNYRQSALEDNAGN